MKQIINFKVNSDIKSNLNIYFINLIEFIIKKYSFIQIKTNFNNNDISNIIIIHNKYGGKISFKKSNNNINELNIYQQNINLLCFNIKVLHEMPFLKKINNFIEISYSSNIINDLSTLLHLIHLITCSIKILDTFPSTINECLYPLDYNKYYYDSFVNFLLFIKLQINKDLSYNKYLLDLLKYYYIYSYYDYYFYYNNSLTNGLIKNINFKNEMFMDFCLNLKKQFKLPDDMYAYPPFFKIEDDIDNLLYYTFEMPNYFKLFDLINAICKVFNIKINDPKKFNIFEILSVIHFEQQTYTSNLIQVDIANDVYYDKYLQNNKIINSNVDIIINKVNNLNKITINNNLDNNNIYNNDNNDNNDNNNNNDNNDNTSKISLNDISQYNKNLIKNNNAFIELNIENSENYALITDINGF
jgi:hypothetical protein